MLGRLRKKRGFTLVEVLVAFVIFAIMAAMVSVIIQSTMRVKQENTSNAQQIEAQKVAYYQKEQPSAKDDYDLKKTDPDNYSGNVKLEFKNDSGSSAGNVSVNYVAADPTGTDDNFELEYYIGEYGNDSWKKTTENSDKTGKNGSLLDELNCGIYGSAGIEDVTVGLVQKPGTPNQYYLFLYLHMFSGSDSTLKPFGQLRLTFPSGVSFKYISANGIDDGNGDKNNAAVQINVMGDGKTLRVSGDGNSRSIFNIGGASPICLITLDTPLTDEQLHDMTKIFGTSGQGTMTSTTRLAKIQYLSQPDYETDIYETKFTQYVSEDDEPKTYVNVFAATAKASTPSAGDKEDTE